MKERLKNLESLPAQISAHPPTDVSHIEERLEFVKDRLKGVESKIEAKQMKSFGSRANDGHAADMNEQMNFLRDKLRFMEQKLDNIQTVPVASKMTDVLAHDKLEFLKEKMKTLEMTNISAKSQHHEMPKPVMAKAPLTNEVIAERLSKIEAALKTTANTLKDPFGDT